MISYILQGKRSPSVGMAEALEDATGICREAWLFPKLHWNPYMKETGSNLPCLTCHRRPEISHKRATVLERLSSRGLITDPITFITAYWDAHQGTIPGVNLGILSFNSEGFSEVATWKGAGRNAPPGEMLENVASGKPYVKTEATKSKILVPRDETVLCCQSELVPYPFDQSDVDVMNRINEVIDYTQKK